MSIVYQPGPSHPTGQFAWLVEIVAADGLTYNSITRDANNAVLSAVVTWPDNTPGVWTADIVSTAFLGVVDSYHVTYIGYVQKTVTQPAVTRNASGAITNQPGLVVA